MFRVSRASDSPFPRRFAVSFQNESVERMRVHVQSIKSIIRDCDPENIYADEVRVQAETGKTTVTLFPTILARLGKDRILSIEGKLSRATRVSKISIINVHDTPAWRYRMGPVSWPRAAELALQRKLLEAPGAV